MQRQRYKHDVENGILAELPEWTCEMRGLSATHQTGKLSAVSVKIIFGLRVERFHGERAQIERTQTPFGDDNKKSKGNSG